MGYVIKFPKNIRRGICRWQYVDYIQTVYTGAELCSQLSEEVLYNLRVNALWYHSILSDNVADNVAPEQS